MPGRALIVVVAFVVLGAACGGDGSAGPPRGRELRLPPNDLARLDAIFGPELGPLGLRLTRGALIDTSDGGYRRSDTGRHLAVYVEPVGEYGQADYANGVVSTARVFLPTVFERWADLESFDVCQEPLPGLDDRAEPPPVTQLYVTGERSAGINWATATPASLLMAAATGGESFTLYVEPTVRADPVFTPAPAGPAA